jgi:predicted nucleotidyltransferase
MIPLKDRNIIRRVARKYGAKKVLLFGSAARTSFRKAHDIDLAVSGVAAADFFSFYGELMMQISKPVDVIDLTAGSPFAAVVDQEGVLVYG